MSMAISKFIHVGSDTHRFLTFNMLLQLPSSTFQRLCRTVQAVIDVPEKRWYSTTANGCVDCELG